MVAPCLSLYETASEPAHSALLRETAAHCTENLGRHCFREGPDAEAMDAAT